MEQPPSATRWLPALLVWSAVLLSLALYDRAPDRVVLAMASKGCPPVGVD